MQRNQVQMKTIQILIALCAISVIASAHTLRRSHRNRRSSRFRAPFLTGETGLGVGSNLNSQTATATGPLTLQDGYALEKLRRFNSERIAERVVHAPGFTAHGYFESFGDFSSLTAARFLGRRRRRTEVALRFSTVVGAKGTPQTVRDPRGFAVRFKDPVDGNFDLVGNNLPVFFIRDQITFPDLSHAFSADPLTDLPNATRVFDFLSALGGEATHMLVFLFSDLGIPANFRTMDGNGVNAYKFVDRSGGFRYVKFRFESMQGIRNLTRAEAAAIQATDTKHATRDLVEAIRRRDFPKWELSIQIMEPSELAEQTFDPLDATKVWPVDQFPPRKLGRLVLNKLPGNVFLDNELIALDPANFLPAAIEPSEDRLLQGRLLSYHESQTHRHQSNNFNRLRANLPKRPLFNYNRNGVMPPSHDWEGSLNYFPNNDPNSFREDPRKLYSRLPICGTTQQKPIERTMNFKQAGELFNSFSKRDQDNFIGNLAADLGPVPSSVIRNKMCAHFYLADRSLGHRVATAVNCNLSTVKAIARTLRD